MFLNQLMDVAISNKCELRIHLFPNLDEGKSLLLYLDEQIKQNKIDSEVADECILKKCLVKMRFWPSSTEDEFIEVMSSDIEEAAKALLEEIR